MELPCGLTNLGNTCYMNATVQCLRSVPELKTALRRWLSFFNPLSMWTEISLARAEVFLHLQVLGSPAIHRTKRTFRLYHSSSSWLVRDHGQDLLEPPAHHLTAVPPHGLSTVCWEGRPGTVPAAGEDPGVATAPHNETVASKRLDLFVSPQDANECWLQMMRVLQQKLDPLELDTPMEVKPVLNSISHPSECEILVSLMLRRDLPNCRQTLRAAPPLPLRRRT